MFPVLLTSKVIAHCCCILLGGLVHRLVMIGRRRRGGWVWEKVRGFFQSFIKKQTSAIITISNSLLTFSFFIPERSCFWQYPVCRPSTWKSQQTAELVNVLHQVTSKQLQICCEGQHSELHSLLAFNLSHCGPIYPDIPFVFN